MAENLLSVREVAEKLGISIRRVHQLITEGKLQAEKYGNQYLIKAVDADVVTVHGKAGRPKIKKDSDQTK